MDSRTLPIAVTARETGISRDLLRKWEARYGFPIPLRSTSGIRAYPPDQVQALREIRRLMDAGVRPAEAIRTCWQDGRLILDAGPATPSGDDVMEPCLETIRGHDVAGLYALLDRKLASMGVEAFISRMAAPLTVAVGEAWQRGELRVHEEHMYSATLANLLSELHRRLQTPGGRPRVLLTTPPGELHTLGIDMVKVMLAEAGAACVSLGAQTPLAEIAAAVSAYRIEVLGLSFSAAYPGRLVGPMLAELQALMPPETPIWIGGAGALSASSLPDGVRIFVSAHDAGKAIRSFSARDRGPVP